MPGPTARERRGSCCSNPPGPWPSVNVIFKLFFFPSNVFTFLANLNIVDKPSTSLFTFFPRFIKNIE